MFFLYAQRRNKTRILLGGVLVISVILALLVHARSLPPLQPSYMPPGEASLPGDVVCLPHRPPDPGTEECAIGFRADTGDHYALDLQDAGTPLSEIPVGTRLVVHGALVPLMAISTDFWQVYDIVGVIRVTAVVSVEAD